MNLLKETLNKLSDGGKSASDVIWVGDGCHWGSWEEFELLAKDIEYDEGFGDNTISMMLMIVGNDWWLERHEYDGSEWWEFRSMPNKPNTKLLSNLIVLDQKWSRK